MYFATDEKNTTFFDVWQEHFKVRFLSDYYEEAGVSELKSEYLGMMEQVCMLARKSNCLIKP